MLSGNLEAIQKAAGCFKSVRGEGFAASVEIRGADLIQRRFLFWGKRKEGDSPVHQWSGDPRLGEVETTSNRPCFAGDLMLCYGGKIGGVCRRPRIVTDTGAARKCCKCKRSPYKFSIKPPATHEYPSFKAFSLQSIHLVVTNFLSIPLPGSRGQSKDRQIGQA